MFPLRLLAVAAIAALSCPGQESTATLENPFTSDADVARGEKIFTSQCA